MNSASQSYYKRFYRLVIVAIIVMTAVLTGSLMIGDSVRASLKERVNERLGKTETIVMTGTGFLNDSILNHNLFSSAHGYLLIEGFVSSNSQMIPVTVWGTDEDSLHRGEVLINQELSHLLSSSSPLVLHLPSSNLIPSGSLFVSQRYATQLRLTIRGVKGKEDGGNILLHNEQVRPINVFMNRQELAEALGIEGKINVICSNKSFSSNEFHQSWHPEFSGLNIQDNIISTDQVFLPENIVDSLKPTTRYLAYFVNSIGNIPYSFVTATDQLHGDEVILSDYTAQRLHAQLGDSITMEYFVSHGELKQLETHSHQFLVSKILPINQFIKQADLITANFPGLSGVNRCTDWDSDLPIDMSRITRTDENYWSEYHQTPKALVSLDAVGNEWTSSFGVATKIVIQDTKSFSSQLTPESFGITVTQPRETALRAAQNGTDFGSLFLALGFFIIISAILLMQNPLLEMYLLRKPEFQLYTTLGFSRQQVFRILFKESLPIVLLAIPIGILIGYAYAAIILWLLSGPWSGATHTDGFALHINPVTMVVSCVLSIIIALIVLCLSIRKGQKTKDELPSGVMKKKGTSSFKTSFLRFINNIIHPNSFLVLLYASLKHFRRQHNLSFWTLTLGVLTVFAVGLNRPDFSHSSKENTGGYQYYIESRIPIQYDLNTPTARHHLRLDDLPTGTHFLQLPKHTEDEASCMNLNQVETPSVLGMNLNDMTDFGIDTDAMQNDSLITVAVDKEALLWSMGKKVGDTLSYHASDGRTVQVVIATSYPTGIFHGNAIMSMEHYRQLWQDETGSRVILEKRSKMDELQKKATQERSMNELMSALSDYGISVSTTTDRLRHFFEVTDTYLRIFLTLGGLGLLLGLVSLLIVIRKNLAARQDEIRLYQTLGFPDTTIVRMLRREQLIVPLLAILAGFLCSLVTISTNIGGAGRVTWLTAIILLLLILLFTWIIIYKSINSKSIQQCEKL